jgi:hypothetical protein
MIYTLFEETKDLSESLIYTEWRTKNRPAVS